LWIPHAERTAAEADGLHDDAEGWMGTSGNWEMPLTAGANLISQFLPKYNPSAS
jgi:hypothetical protein